MTRLGNTNGHMRSPPPPPLSRSDNSVIGREATSSWIVAFLFSYTTNPVSITATEIPTSNGCYERKRRKSPVYQHPGYFNTALFHLLPSHVHYIICSRMKWLWLLLREPERKRRRRRVKWSCQCNFVPCDCWLCDMEHFLLQSARY